MHKVEIMGSRMTHFPRRLKLAAASLAVLAIGGGALAAEPSPSKRAAVLQGLLDCKTKSDNTERLACYDAAAAAVDQAEAKGDIVVVDREQARTVRRQAFGFTMPSISLFERGEKPEQIDRVSGVVASAKMDGSGKWVIKLEDGAVWNQIDVTVVPRDPRPGMPVTVRSATMGSYLLSVAGQPAFRAHRAQ
jgi:hypothetical protein